MIDRLEYAAAEEGFLDFCLWEYMPVAPYVGKLRSASLLFNSFEVAGVSQRAFDFVTAIRNGFGVSRTVWGVKKLASHLAWEFYFYDYRRTQRERSVSRFMEIAQPFVDCVLAVNENLPYFMFSVDVDEKLLSRQRSLDEIHLYIGNTGSTVSSGICYSLISSGMRLENLYYFFDVRTQMQAIASKASCSVYFDAAIASIDQVLWPELRASEVIVVANKQSNDGVYFSRINVDQLIFFLKRLAYPDEICGFVEKHRSQLDHMLYDVGFDYRMEAGELVILKSGFYGIF